MTLDEINGLLKRLHEKPERENVLQLVDAIIEWMGLKPFEKGKLSEVKRGEPIQPHFMNLQNSLTKDPLTNQPQLYRVTSKNEPILIRFAVIKNKGAGYAIRKELIHRLVHVDVSMDSYQNTPSVLQNKTTNPYYIHFVTTPQYDRLYVILNQQGQKRVLTLRGRLTQNQFKNILSKWENIAAKPKAEVAAVLWKSLDLKEVNKQFYTQVKEKFDDLVGLLKQDKTVKSEAENVIKHFAVRLIGRYIFCWFLKEKGIIESALVESQTVKATERFYERVLLPLFFETLNSYPYPKRTYKSDVPKELQPHLHRIPYLNGGLFDESVDDKKFRKISVDTWLVKFVDVLESYAFTVDESSQNYQQVAIDPEMLGRIFENLLAALNPETEKVANDRKSFGAFYTPREVVEYMVTESLKSYLEANMLMSMDEEQCSAESLTMVSEPSATLFSHVEPKQLSIQTDTRTFAHRAKAEQYNLRMREKIKKLFHEDIDGKIFDKKDDEQKVRQLLREVKVLDPACGSGAFPMGILYKLEALHEVLGTTDTSYELRKRILSCNVYGVDVMPMGVEISRLRAWLALVLVNDYKPNDSKHNFNIKPLPNLDFKFVTANTLIDSGYDEFLHKVDRVGSLTMQKLDKEVQKLERIKEDYFDASETNKNKESLVKEFNDTKSYIKKEFSSLRRARGLNLADFMNKIDDWDPFDDNKISSFFSPAWMFGITNGFDIVIGNPPYLRIQGIREANPDLADILTKTYKAANGSFDLYVVFVERAMALIKSNGLVNFIMPTKWTNAAFGKGLRQVISERNAASKIINFGAYQVFDASTYTGLHWFKPDAKDLLYFELDRDLKSNDELSDYLQSVTTSQGNVISNARLTNAIWTLTSSGTSKIIDKLNQQPRRISDVFEKIFQGLATSKDDVYFLYNCVEENDHVVGFSKQLNRSIKIEKSFVKPLLKGEDVHRYDHIHSNRVVVFPYRLTKGNAELYREVEIRKQFPLAYQYLKECESILRDRENGRLKSDTHWYRYIYPKNLTLFANEKLVAPEISLRGNFAYDENGDFYFTTKIYGYVKKPTTGESYLVWLALFNSKLFWYFIRQTGYVLRGGYYTFKTNYILPFPVPNAIPTAKCVSIEELVKSILSKKRTARDKSNFPEEIEIDKIIYELYGLSISEVEVVESEIKG